MHVGSRRKLLALRTLLIEDFEEGTTLFHIRLNGTDSRFFSISMVKLCWTPKNNRSQPARRRTGERALTAKQNRLLSVHFSVNPELFF